MHERKMIAVVGMGAILPDAEDTAAFWSNITSGRYSVTEVPENRWNTALYFDPNPSVPDKTYSKIGGFVKDYHFDPLKNGIPIPPKVLSVMDTAQQWAIAASHQALKDYGYPEKVLDPERVAVIFGNSNAGEGHYRSTFRILLPEYLEALSNVPDFELLPENVRMALIEGVRKSIQSRIPVITEDTMPGELSNIISGRVANVFNFSGPNFVTDAACASSIAAMQAACEGLQAGKFDAALTGGIDRSMGPESYIKFCKIGALSGDGSRPYAEGANGFVMGEGAAVFLLKRLEDAEHDGDKIYAVIRGIGGSSDGKGKGITAPNPLGQQRAIERAWQDAQINPACVGLIEGHGTSTKVGDVTEVNSLTRVFGSLGLKNGSVMLGSVKSNIGHLKSAAGAAGLLKTILSLHHQVLPPSANFAKPNPDIPFKDLPFRVNTQPQEWVVKDGNFRFAGVSAFGFGGTNFHVVLEEYFPGVGSGISRPHTVSALNTPFLNAPVQNEATDNFQSAREAGKAAPQSVDLDQIQKYVLSTVSEKTGYPVEMLDPDLDLEADLGIDTVKQAELFATIRTQYGIPRREDLRLSEYNTLARVIRFVTDSLAAVAVLSNADKGQVETPKEAAEAASTISAVNETMLKPYQGLYFASADTSADLYARIQTDLQALSNGVVPESRCPNGNELSMRERIAIDYANPEELGRRLEKASEAAHNDNPQIWKALQAHSIYRGSGTPGKVAFLFPGQGSQYINMLLDLRDTEPIVKDTFDEADRVMSPILGKPLTQFIYTTGDEDEIAQAEKELKKTAVTQPAMLTANVAVMRVLQKYGVEPDLVIGHSLGEYAALVAAGVLSFAEALKVVSARGSEMTKIEADDPGCMAAVSAPLEIVEEVIRSIEEYVVIANINSPIQCVLGGTTPAIDQALAKFQAAGFQAVKIPVSHAFHTKIVAPASHPLRRAIEQMNLSRPSLPIVANVTGELYPTGREEILDLLASQVASPVQFVKGMQTLYRQGARIFIEAGPKRVLSTLAADNLKDKEDIRIIATNHPRKGGKASFNEALCSIYAAGIPSPKEVERPVILSSRSNQAEVARLPVMTSEGSIPPTGSVVISGAGLGLPGRDKHVFEDGNIESVLRGDMRIEPLPEDARRGMLDRHITRLVKSEAGAVMEDITDIDQVLKLAGQSGQFDLTGEFGIPQERVDALDKSTQLAIAAGIEALRDAGIPLVMHYRRTTKGTFLPDRWKLPESMQDETGVIFCSAFPGLNRIVDEADRYYETKILENELQNLKETAELIYTLFPTGQTQIQNDLQRRIFETENKIRQADYHFDRRYIFRILSMGHSQFAEYIGARGPNTHVNAACSTTTQGVAVAEDWIRSGRCRRVIVIAGDDVTNSALIPWIGSSLFASGAATPEGDLRKAALPFDRRRNGLIMGMGAAALVIESEDAVRERGVRAIGEILSTVFANSAFHGTQLDVQHVSRVMDHLLSTAEKRFGIDRREIAPNTVFVSHETYTPARGGSASAEIHALRSCFGDLANRVVITNTKGYTGHSMGVGIEDVIAAKALETGIVPPVAHIQDGFEPDEELGNLNLSKGGQYNPQYYLRLGAGFGSQIAMTLVRRIPGKGERIDREKYDRWLSAASGYEHADLEVVQRTLRVQSKGVPAAAPAKSGWQYGQVPRLWAAKDAAGDETAPSGLLQLAQAAETLSAPAEIAETVTLAGLANGEEITGRTDAGAEEIRQYVLSTVSEKTGYPSEMLDLDLDLEADLGIDTVKQAELFAAIRTHFEIPRREDLRLSEYNTLAKVIRFIQDGIAAKTSAKPVEAAATASKPDAEPEKSGEKVNILRRVPLPVLLPRLDLCVPTGVCLEESRVIVMGGESGAAAALTEKLKTLNAEVFLVSLPDAAEKITEIARSGKIDGLYFLSTLDDDPEWAAKIDGENRSVKDALVQALYHAVRSLPGEAFIIAATRMGGFHGFIDPQNPMGGLVSGFLKALRRERPGQLIKVVDFGTGAQAELIAGQLIAETLNDPATVEVGCEDGLRYTFVIRPENQLQGSIKPLREGSVFVVSGGTGGITGAIVRDLAKGTRGTFYLLGRSKVDAQDAELISFQKDPAVFRADLQSRCIAGGEKITPVQMEQKMAAFRRAADTCRVMRSVEEYGGKVVYLQCDVTDPSAVKMVIQTIAGVETKVDVFIHAAGTDWSRRIENKTLDEVQQVISVKADGFTIIFNALEHQNLLPERVVFFSSVAGRFGNSGQTDYSAANDLLSKYALWLPKKYPSMQALSVDWGAWADVGMASRGRIPDLMKLAGIDMMHPEEAAPILRSELEAGACGEVVISGSLGLLEKSAGENDLMDIAKGDEALRAGEPVHRMLSHLTGYDPQNGVVLEAELNPQELGFLRDHSINGIPVLPGVAGIEGFSIAARHIVSVLASDGIGFELERLEDIRFLSPFKFYGNKPRILTWHGSAFRDERGLCVQVSLESDHQRWNGQVDHTVHFTGLVHLARGSSNAEAAAKPPKWGKQKSVQAEEIYKLFFHGPSFQVLEAAQGSGSVVLGRLNKQTVRVHADEPALQTAPMLIELCFQTAGLWEVGATGTMALPKSVGSLRMFNQPMNGVPVYAEVKPKNIEGQVSFDARVIDARGNLFLEMTNYRTSPLPNPAEKDLSEPMKALVASEGSK